MRTRRIVLLLTALTVLAQGTAGAIPSPEERSRTTPTGWHWYLGVDATFLTERIDRQNLRLIDIEIASAATPTFNAVLVENTGDYASAWWWFFGVSANYLKDQTKRLKARILDLETYVVGGQRRYAAILLPNTGAKATGWWWWLNVTPKTIANKVDNLKARVIDLDPRGNGRYNAVMVRNTGAEASAWWYFYRVRPKYIAKRLNKHKARLIDIERDGSGRFTVVMVRNTGGAYWWWYHGKTAAGVAGRLAQHGARLVDLERYSVKGRTRYAAVMVNNVNAVTTKVREIMAPAAKKAAFGFYLKRVGGPTYAALQEKKVFEPASMIKVVHHLTAMQAVQGNTAELDENVTWYRRPDDPATTGDESMNGGVCAYEDDGDPITSLPQTNTLSFVLSGMMKQSDNRHTDAVYNRFGRSAINATADSLGMFSTELNHRIGCTWEAAEVAAANEFTLYDAGLLYEAVADGTALDETHRALFYQHMNGDTPWWSKLTAMINGLSIPGVTSGEKAAFIAAIDGAWKPGGYLNYVDPCNASTCGHLSRNTVGGSVDLPFKQSGVVVPRTYVYGNFVDGVFTCPGPHTQQNPTCQPQFAAVGEARGDGFVAMLKPQIKAALQTWA